MVEEKKLNEKTGHSRRDKNAQSTLVHTGKLQAQRSEDKKGFEIDRISETEFWFSSQWTFGSSGGQPINGIGKIETVDDNKAVIHLATKVRSEIYFLFGILFIIFLILLFSEENFPFWVYPLLPVCLVWFWIVYRVQEVYLFKRLKKYLDNGN